MKNRAIPNYSLDKENLSMVKYGAACKLDYLPSSRRELTMTKEDVQENKPYELRKRFKSSAFSKQVKAGSISVNFFTLLSSKMDLDN